MVVVLTLISFKIAGYPSFRTHIYVSKHPRGKFFLFFLRDRRFFLDSRLRISNLESSTSESSFQDRALVDCAFQLEID